MAHNPPATLKTHIFQLKMIFALLKAISQHSSSCMFDESLLRDRHQGVGASPGKSPPLFGNWIPV